MDALVEFLTARLDEDEADWRAVASRDVVQMLHGKPIAPRMLREVEAKRRIMAAHPILRYSTPNTPLSRLRPAGRGKGYRCETCRDTDGYCDTLMALALPHADHPDYREEWRP